MRKTFRMNDEQLEKLFEACKPVPYMIIGGVAPSTPQERANAAWCALGREMGFNGMSVKKLGNDPHDFTAEEITVDLCQTCGIGFRLPSGRCDHCNTMFP